MDEPLLEIRGATKTWPSFRMEGVDLVLPGGLILGLVGANGAGKTTLLKLAMGLLRPDGGTFRFRGRDFGKDGKDLRRRIGYGPEEPRFPAEARLEALGRAYGRFYPDWDGGRWRTLMGEFGLDPRAKAGTLSMGMRTKAALALVLAREADLLVLDEPTTALDPVFRRELLRRLSGLIQDEGRAILFSTHITTDLEDRVDLVALLRSGRLVFNLDRETLRERYVLVKGDPALLEQAGRDAFLGLRTTPHGFEALAEDGPALRDLLGGRALVERPSLEDLVVLMGRRPLHVP